MHSYDNIMDKHKWNQHIYCTCQRMHVPASPLDDCAKSLPPVVEPMASSGRLCCEGLGQPEQNSISIRTKRAPKKSQSDTMLPILHNFAKRSIVRSRQHAWWRAISLSSDHNFHAGDSVWSHHDLSITYQTDIDLLVWVNSLGSCNAKPLYCIVLHGYQIYQHVWCLSVFHSGFQLGYIQRNIRGGRFGHCLCEPWIQLCRREPLVGICSWVCNYLGAHRASYDNVQFLQYNIV